jgi:hypothetical protein
VQPLKAETGEKYTDSLSELDVKRDTILSWLKQDIGWLRKHSRQKYLGKDFLKRVKGLRASIHGCSIYLSALKNEELEFQVKQLEEMIENGIVIPNDPSAKKNRRIKK